MDRADAWLREHDPDYSDSRLAWPNIGTDGEYRPPWREELVGDAETVDRLLVTDIAAPLITSFSAERHCVECKRSYMPYKRGHVYCSKRCRNRAFMRRLRGAVRP